MRIKSVFFILVLIYLINPENTLGFDEKSGNYEKLIRVYSEQIEKDYSDYKAYNGRGVTWFYMYKFGRALSDYTSALKINPQYSEAYCNRGIVWLYKKNYDEAINDFDRAINLREDYYEAFCYRGDAWYKKGRFNLALADYDTAIKIFPDYANAYNNRGFVLSKNGVYGLAIYDYKKALKIEPELFDANINLAWLFASCTDERYRNGESAVLYAMKANQFKTTPFSLDTLAAAYAETNDYKKAVSTQKKAIDLLEEQNRYELMSQFNKKLALYKSGNPIPVQNIIKKSPHPREATDKPGPQIQSNNPPLSDFSNKIEYKQPYTEAENNAVQTESVIRHSFFKTEKTASDKSKDNENFEHFLNTKGFRESRKDAIKAVLAQWGSDSTISEEQNKPSNTLSFFSLIAGSNDFRILTLNKDLEMIKRLNLPVILRFKLPGSNSPRYYTLTGLTDNSASFITNNEREVFEVPISELRKFWTGEIYLVWKNHMGIEGTVPKNSPQHSVVILKTVLLQMGIKNLAINPDYDQQTREKVMEFQKMKGISVDGMVGPVTKIMLYNELKYLKIPHIINELKKQETE